MLLHNAGICSKYPPILPYLLFCYLCKKTKYFMKKVLVFGILLMCIVTYTLQAQSETTLNVKLYTIKQALELQKKQPRKIIIDVYTDWCGWCKKMDKETFNHPVIADYLNKNFYFVKFNAESFDSVVFNNHTYVNQKTGTRSTHQFASALLSGQNSYPSVAYLDEKLQLIAAVPGFYTADKLEPLLTFIVEDKYKTISMEEFMKTFVSKIKNP